MKQVKKFMSAKDKHGEFGEEIIGNVHAVDGMGYGHTHLPVGQGMNPIKDAIKYLIDKGYGGNINSEGHSEGPDRQLFKTWESFGSPIYAAAMAPRFRQLHQGHVGYTAPPFYIVGAYSPSNDWRLWSEVPLE